jgi:hypothetical protein
MTATPILTYPKDPQATAKIGWDWTAWLAGDATLDTPDDILAHTVTVPAGLTLVSSSATAKIVTAFVSGGTAGTNYDVVCRVTTAQGLVDERTYRVAVGEQ